MINDPIRICCTPLFALLLIACPCASWSMNSQARTVAISDSQCLSAAKSALGPNAEVLKCGELTKTRALEAVAFLPLKGLRKTTDGTPISKLVVLRRERSQWVVELTADQNPPRNRVGYIGIDYIDDSEKGGRYRISCHDEGSNEIPRFTIALFYLSPNGENQGMPVEIAWNRPLRRFQEYTVNHEPEGFQPENKNPPHIHRRKS